MDSITLKTDYAYSLEYTALSHGWVKLAPFSWDESSKVLSRFGIVTSEPVRWQVKQTSPNELLVTYDRCLSDDGIEKLLIAIKRSLMLNWSPEEAICKASRINTNIANFIEKGGGRFLRGAHFFEDFYKTVCTINTSWTNTLKMVLSLQNFHGHSQAAMPGDIITISVDDLQNKCPLGYRARVLKEATQLLFDNQLLLASGELTIPQIAREVLLELRGIGPYAADHLMILQGDYSRIPVDSEVTAYCQKEYGITEREINDHFADWGHYRFLGYKVDRILKRTNWIG
jgi:N-glycosylase/DNA lyase